VEIGGAGSAQRAGVAAGIFGQADEGAEFHEGLVVEAGVAARDEATGEGA